jgi:hypothetical protein
VAEGTPCQENGMIISFGFRVIAKDQRIGLGDEPTPGLFGWVELLSGWELSKNKDKILGLDQLGPAIYERFRPIIELASKRSKAVAFQNVSKEINKLLSDILGEDGKGKEKRDAKSNETGTVQPKNTQRKRRRAQKIQLGDVLDNPLRKSKGLQIAFDRFGEDGPFWKCQENIVYLNLDNRALKYDQNNERAVMCYAVHAVSVYFVLNEKASQFAFMRQSEKEYEQIATLTGHLLARLNLPGSDLRIAGEGA